jgi:hypothetical protein
MTVDIDFEDYVREILRDMPAGLNRQQFRGRCIPDLNAGYRDEVAEAERRYFSTKEKR